LTGKPGSWRYNKALLGFYEIGENSIYSQENLNSVQNYLTLMNDLCQDYDASFITYFVPGAVEVSQPSDIFYFPWDQDLHDKSRFDLDRPYATLLEISNALKIPVVNLYKPLKEYPNQPVYFRDSWHWNQDGHRAVAAFIASDLVQRGLLEKYK
jgi:hypothetical protein